MKEKKTAIEDYNEAVIALVQEFSYEYRYDELITEDSFVGNNIGDVVMLGDEFWDIRDIKTALENNIPNDILFAWYDESLESHAKKKTVINLINYFKK